MGRATESRASRLLFGMLGRVERTEPAAVSDGVALWTVLFSGLGMYLGERYALTGPPFVSGAWRFAVHGAVPLAGVVLLERPRTATRAVAGLLGAAACLVPIATGLVPTCAARLQHAPEGAVAAVEVLGFAAMLAAIGPRGRARWGLGLGRPRWWAPRAALIVAGLVPFVAGAAWFFPALARFYPTDPAARHALGAFVHAHAGIALDFVGWEALFRGVLLCGLARRGDPWLAILAQAMPFFVLHHPKPDAELASSLVGGILAGWFAWSARSFVPVVLLHGSMITLMGVAGVLAQRP